MPFKHRFLPGFSDSLADITAYLSEIAPIYSVRFLDDLSHQIETLSDMPYLYPKYEFDNRFHKMSMGDWKYVSFYIVDEEKREIIFYDILHMSRDIPSYLKSKFGE